MRKLLNWIAGRAGWKSRPVVSVSPGTDRDRHRKKLGKLGEEAAVSKLLKEGYRIIERNYLCRSGEIDIIAEHKGEVVFVEVKTRSPRAWDTPESAVTTEKQARVIRAAIYYQSGFRHPSSARYDIVSVMTDHSDNVVSVEIKKNAFGPGMM